MSAVLTKEKRAKFLKEALDNAGVDTWGRLKIITETIGVSKPTAQGWLLGAMPSDVNQFLTVCDTYNIDPHEWVYGESKKKAKEVQDLADVLGAVRAFKDKRDVNLTDEQTAKLILIMLEEGTSIVSRLTNL